MEFNITAIGYIIGIIILLSVLYAIYILYTDLSSLRVDVENLQNNFSLLIADISKDKEKDEETLDREYGDDEDDDEEGVDLGTKLDFENPEWIQKNIFDQFLLTPEHLHNLQQLQMEMKNGTPMVTEINQDNNQSAEGDDEYTDTELDEDEDAEFLKNDLEVNSQEIEVDRDNEEDIRCNKILTTGKNKGEKCTRKIYDNSEFCKIHYPN